MFIASCSGNEKPEEEKVEEKACFYSYNEGSTVVEWSAYKFTEKKENRQETEPEAKPGQRRAAACERLPS